MNYDPKLSDELYHKQRKNFPDQLPFPERFNLKLTQEAFNTGKIRETKSTIRKYVDWKGNTTGEEPITVIEYTDPSRLDRAIRDSFPKSFQPLSYVYSQSYDKIQVGTINEEKDLEYNLKLYPRDPRTKSVIISYDTIKTWDMNPPDNRNKILRVRIQYAEQIVNSDGARFDLHGYIYIPQKRKQYQP